jgi:hypothetical protein
MGIPAKKFLCWRLQPQSYDLFCPESLRVTPHSSVFTEATTGETHGAGHR